MAQLEHIEAIEKQLWRAADTLRANSNYASNEYFIPVMGLIFLRHAYSRYLAVKDAIEASLPTRAEDPGSHSCQLYGNRRAPESRRGLPARFPCVSCAALPILRIAAQVPPSRRAPWTAYGRPGTRHFTS